MANSIAYRKNYTDILDRVYQRAACSTVLNSPHSMARAGRNAKEIMIPKISVSGLGDYKRNVGSRRAPSPSNTRRSPSTTTAASSTSPT